MKRVFVFLSVLFFAISVNADQLAYLSKEQATKAKEILEKMNQVYLYCGCCDNDTKMLVKVLKAEVKFTNYEDYYEVILTYTDDTGKTNSEGIDLAYVWTSTKGEIKTIGELLNMDHDPCKRLIELK